MTVAVPSSARRDLGAWLGAAAVVMLVVALSADDGGYFEASWGWSALVLLWIAALAAITSAPRHPPVAAAIFVGGFVVFFALTIASALWAPDPGAAIREAQRLLIYVAAIASGVICMHRRGTKLLVPGLWLAVVAVCAYSLTTRLLPDQLGLLDPLAGNRLSEPLGYWNALSALAGLGLLLALALATNAERAALRLAAAASLPVLASTLYFTFGRAGWVALAVGLLTAMAIDPTRLESLARIVVVGLPSVLAVAVCANNSALISPDAVVGSDAVEEGRRVVLALALCAALSALAAAGAARIRISAHLRGTRRLRRVVVVAGILLVGTVAIHQGGSAVPSRIWSEFRQPAPRLESSLNDRLFSISGNGRSEQWETAWGVARDHPVSGAGAGSYERYWLERRDRPAKVRDAHSLYLETLAELGLAGLATLVVTLAVPLVAAWRARRRALAPLLAGAYVAFLVHAGVDWDWEIPALTIAALGCALALLALGEPGAGRPLGRGSRTAIAVVALAGCAFALTGFVANQALLRSVEATAAGQWEEAVASARRADRFAPWSSEPERRAGEALVEAGRHRAARTYFARGIARSEEDWKLWFGLTLSSTGAERERAFRRAVALNPLAPELASVRDLP